MASDAAATEAATEAAPAASDDSGHAAGEQQQQQGYAGQGDYSGYGSASAAVDYSTGGYDPQAYAAYAGHYDPSMAYGGYGASGYAAAGSAAAAPPAAAAPAVPSAPIPDSHSPDPPSKVLHFRNVTSELTQVCLPPPKLSPASSCVVSRRVIAVPNCSGLVLDGERRAGGHHGVGGALRHGGEGGDADVQEPGPPRVR